MTTLAQVFGALPLVRAGGAGAESRGTIGLVVIGGMLFATAFTLFLTPVLYRLMAGYTRPTNWISERLKEQETLVDAREGAAAEPVDGPVRPTPAQ